MLALPGLAGPEEIIQNHFLLLRRSCSSQPAVVCVEIDGWVVLALAEAWPRGLPTACQHVMIK